MTRKVTLNFNFFSCHSDRRRRGFDGKLGCFAVTKEGASSIKTVGSRVEKTGC